MNIAVKVGRILAAYIIADVIWTGIKNKMNGKTVFGNEPKQKKKTYMNWKGDIILGNEDYSVA